MTAEWKQIKQNEQSEKDMNSRGNYQYDPAEKLPKQKSRIRWLLLDLFFDCTKIFVQFNLVWKIEWLCTPTSTWSRQHLEMNATWSGWTLLLAICKHGCIMLNLFFDPLEMVCFSGCPNYTDLHEFCTTNIQRAEPRQHSEMNSTSSGWTR